MIRELSIELQQPTQVRQGVSADNYLSTVQYLPGATIRGAFAAAWIGQFGQPVPDNPGRGEFLELFEGGLRFSPAYLHDPPVSLAVVRHKYAAEAACDPVEIDEAVSPNHPPICTTCKHPWESRPGLRDGDGAATQRHTSAPMDPATGRAKDGDLFTRDAMRPQHLSGSIIGPEGLLSTLEKCVPHGLISFGARRTTHGLSTVSFGAPIDPPMVASKELVIRLASPAVLVDAQGRPTLELDCTQLGEILGMPVTVKRRWVRWDQVSGWHAASGLPKPGELVAAAGCTYVVECPQAPDRAKVVALFEHGVGIRRHEGFGHLTGATRLALTARAIAARTERRAKASTLLTGVAEHPDIAQAIVDHVAGDTQAAERARQLAAAIPDSLGVARGRVRRLLELPVDDIRAAMKEMQA